MNKIISGIRPTGKLHLGNYIGSILPALRHDAYVLIAEYHAPYGNVALLTKELLRFFRSDRILFQSAEFDARLYFELLQETSSGLLSHMPQYKEKEKTAHMFVYPVLMAADIAEYDYVIVGDDQRPHIELANDILPKIGYSCPIPIFEGGRVMDLRHPSKKMSKSDPDSCLFLSDDESTRERKIMKAVTDEAGRKNLEFIFTSLGGSVPPAMSVDLKRAICKLLTAKLGA